jgi:hypothetical protein
MSAMVGHTFEELVEIKGPPSSEFAMPNGDKIYTWRKDGATVTDYTSKSVLTSAYSKSRTNSCQKDYTVGTDGIIKSFRWEGSC